jgi:hypothetical protein
MAHTSLLLIVLSLYCACVCDKDSDLFLVLSFTCPAELGQAREISTQIERYETTEDWSSASDVTSAGAGRQTTKPKPKRHKRPRFLAKDLVCLTWPKRG